MVKNQRNKIYQIYRFLRKGFLLAGLVFILLFIFSHLLVILHSRDIIYTDIQDITGQKTALVLGTSKYARKNVHNLFYQYRIEATAELYHSGKIKEIVLSGHTDHYYNEPETMSLDLIDLGIPKEVIIEDKFGDSTIDSVLNLKNNYGITENIVIVSQNFHLQRALLLASVYDIKAVGFRAQSPPLIHGYKTYPREVLARIKLLWDLLAR